MMIKPFSRFTLLAVTFLVISLGIGGRETSMFAQVLNEPSTPDTNDPVKDWVSEMPVSLNGKLSEQIPPNWEKHHWHDFLSGGYWVRSNWKASNFFDDPEIVELCDAIFDRNVPKMERLIASGADVNTIGQNGMTPLYWALHMDLDPGPFACLMRHGADPNIIVDVRKRKEHQVAIPGSAVVHLVAQGTYNRQFKNVFENGGDPNLIRSTVLFVATPFHLISPNAPDAAERLRLLIAQGAEIDSRHDNGPTYASSSVVGGVEKRCRLAMVVLKEGADYRLYYKESGRYFRMIHYLAHAEPKVNERPVEEQTHYRAVVAWLEDHGESLGEAKADLKRWDEWKKDGELGLIEKEHQKRLAQEAEKKQSNEKNDRVQAGR